MIGAVLFFMNVIEFLFGSWYTMINFSLQDSELTRVGSGNLLEQIITEDIGLGYLFSAITPLSPFLFKKKEKKNTRFISFISEYFLFCRCTSISLSLFSYLFISC